MSDDNGNNPFGWNPTPDYVRTQVQIDFNSYSYPRDVQNTDYVTRTTYQAEWSRLERERNGG